jgi:putative ABC transport system permease protein
LTIGFWQLALAGGLIVVAGAISLVLSLGLLRSLLVGALRTYFQLLALGFVLRWVFGIDHVLLVLALLLVMILFAAQILLGRVHLRPQGIFGHAFLALFLSSLSVTFLVTTTVIGVSPWYRAQYVIPLAGMMLGNSMNGIGLALERLFGDLRARRREMEMMFALGAGRREVAQPSIQSAVRAGLIPTINSMSAVGIVFIPGMMTGQILAGAPPLDAAAYQIVIILMISAATALGIIIVVFLTYRRAFDENLCFVL